MIQIDRFSLYVKQLNTQLIMMLFEIDNYFC